MPRRLTARHYDLLAYFAGEQGSRAPEATEQPALTALVERGWLEASRINPQASESRKRVRLLCRKDGSTRKDPNENRQTPLAAGRRVATKTWQSSQSSPSRIVRLSTRLLRRRSIHRRRANGSGKSRSPHVRRQVRSCLGTIASGTCLEWSRMHCDASYRGRGQKNASPRPDFLTVAPG